MISNEIKNSITSYSTNDNLNIIEKSLNKLKEINLEYSDISQKFNSLNLDLNELIYELENKLNDVAYEEINFDEIDERIYQYQQLSKFFEVEPKNLYSIKEEILNEIDSLENFHKERENKFNKYIEALNNYYANALNNFKNEALKVSNLRKKESKKISENINKQLPIVNIEQGEIIFKFSEKDEKDYNIDGYDELDVLFRTNKNSDYNSIKK